MSAQRNAHIMWARCNAHIIWAQCNAHKMAAQRSSWTFAPTFSLPIIDLYTDELQYYHRRYIIQLFTYCLGRCHHQIQWGLWSSCVRVFVFYYGFRFTMDCIADNRSYRMTFCKIIYKTSRDEKMWKTIEPLPLLMHYDFQCICLDRETIKALSEVWWSFWTEVKIWTLMSGRVWYHERQGVVWREAGYGMTRSRVWYD